MSIEIKDPVALTYRFFDWLQKKYKLRYSAIVIKIGGLNAGVSDIDWNQHFKAREFSSTTREELIAAISDMNEFEKGFIQ